MKKIYTIILLLALSFNFLFGQKMIQDFQTSWANEKLPKKYTFEKAIGSINGYSYIAAKNSSTLRIYDKIIKINEKGVKVKIGKELNTSVNEQYHFAFQVNNKIIVCISEINTRDNTINLYASELDLETCNLKEGKKLIGQLEFEGGEKYLRDVFFYTISPDSSKIAVFYKTSKKEILKNPPFEYVVLDTNLQVLNANKIYLNYGDCLYNVADYSVDNNGNFFLMGSAKFYEGSGPVTVAGDIRFFDVLIYDVKGKQSNFKIELEDKLLTKMKMTTHNGFLYCMGFYSKLPQEDRMAGTITYKYDISDKKLISKDINDFSIELMTTGFSEKLTKRAEKRQLKRGDLELLYLEIREIYTVSDGIIAVCNEHSYYKGSKKDMLVFKIDFDNMLKWTKKLRRTELGTQYSQTFILNNGDDIYMLFNDSDKNIFKNKKFFLGIHYFDVSHRDVCIAALKIDKDGNYNKYVVERNANLNSTYFIPDLASQIADNKAIILTKNLQTRKSIYKIGIIEF